MFSEYASRFLAQSQSRLLSSQTDRATSPEPFGRDRSRSARASSRIQFHRHSLGNPYQGVAPQSSRFPFASRFNTKPAQAPLFYSATDEFREEDDGQEHDREVADFYALQRSRKDFGHSRLTESDESDKERPAGMPSNKRLLGQRNKVVDARRGGGIRSSWTEEEEQASKDAAKNLADDTAKRRSTAESSASLDGRRRDRLVDVELASTIHEDQEPEDEHHNEFEGLPRPDPRPRPPVIDNYPLGASKVFRDVVPSLLRPRPPSPDVESVPPTVDTPPSSQPRHDSFWSTLYFISIAAMFSSFLLSLLHNPSPPSTGLLGDTIYTTLHSSFYLLAVDTLVATIVALFWLAMLRSFVKPLIFLVLVAVPIIAFSFSLYPFISSFGGSWHGGSIQDQAMRWLSPLPAIFAIGWIYTAYKSRQSLGRSVELLEFSTRVLAANPILVLAGFATLVGVVVWTWAWMLMFTRLFLGGHYARNLFYIDTGTWCLAAFFVLNYLWTLSIFSGIQRATSAATVSQWYFHRLTDPSVRSPRVVRAAFDHAISAIFGTICLSTLLSLAVRLPLLILPRRLGGVIAMCFYTFVPTSIITLTNSLTLTYAAIHSQNLVVSAQAVAEMSFLPVKSATTTLTPGAAARSSANSNQVNPANNTQPSLIAYRLAKLLLHATRFITTLAFAFGGWVSTARMLTIDCASAGMKGSLYAYVVGLIAGAIGWAVLGAMEGVLGGVLDAVVVCWGSEIGSGGRDGGDLRAAGTGYCREAGELLGGDLGGRGGDGGGIGL